LLKNLQENINPLSFVLSQWIIGGCSLSNKTMLGGEIFWQTHLLVPVAEILENRKV